VKHTQTKLPWLDPGQSFPPPANAWGPGEPAPGLLAAGGALDVQTLLDAYSQGIFPWFSDGQPILWWSPQPRMVLQMHNFKLHRSLRKKITRLLMPDSGYELKVDSAFGQVVRACASAAREGQAGTWIVEKMVHAYIALHKAGHAHSVETWIDGELAGGLYCVSIGKMVFGESMFARQTDASKIALSALVAFCRANAIEMIDCQQNTGHLASLGAGEITRADFAGHLTRNLNKDAPSWRFEPVYWDQILLSQQQTRLILP
jgi:leucyl/phenylalanyl-tRNA--protein transferase